MNSNLSVFVRLFFPVPTAMTIWLISFFGFNHSYWLASGIAIASGFLTNWGISIYYNAKFLKKYRLTRKEYSYIKKNLKVAKKKISRLHVAILSIRHIPSLKQRFELVKITRKIYRLTKKEPNRFFKAEPFYYSHLDSALELAEKYVFLSRQPKKNSELEQALYDTRRTLEEITKSIEEDLYHIISNDIEDLHFELDVAKHVMKNKKPPVNK